MLILTVPIDEREKSSHNFYVFYYAGILFITRLFSNIDEMLMLLCEMTINSLKTYIMNSIFIQIISTFFNNAYELNRIYLIYH